MNWTEKRKSGNFDKPSFTHKRIKLSKGEMIHYDGNENVSIKEVRGALLGDCLQIEAFDTRLNKSWRTPYIFDRDNVIIFDPTGKKVTDKPISYHEAKKIIADGSGARPRIFYVIWVYDYNNDEVYSISTNISIAIEQYNKNKLSLDKGFEIILTPEIYNEKSNISSETKNMLGKLALKNPPTFANISIGDIISNEDAESFGIITKIEEFNTFSNNKNVTKTDNTDNIDDNFYEKTNKNQPSDNDDNLPF